MEGGREKCTRRTGFSHSIFFFFLAFFGISQEGEKKKNYMLPFRLQVFFSVIAPASNFSWWSPRQKGSLDQSGRAYKYSASFSHTYTVDFSPSFSFPFPLPGLPTNFCAHPLLPIPSRRKTSMTLSLQEKNQASTHSQDRTYEKTGINTRPSCIVLAIGTPCIFSVPS